MVFGFGPGKTSSFVSRFLFIRSHHPVDITNASCAPRVSCFAVTTVIHFLGFYLRKNCGVTMNRKILFDGFPSIGKAVANHIVVLKFLPLRCAWFYQDHDISPKKRRSADGRYFFNPLPTLHALPHILDCINPIGDDGGLPCRMKRRPLPWVAFEPRTSAKIVLLLPIA